MGRAGGEVAAFITRTGLDGPALLVLGDLTVPSSTLEPGEDPLAGARRVAWAQAGLDQLAVVDDLGEIEGTYAVHLASEVETADNWWVTSGWRCPWTPIGAVPAAAPFRDRLTAAALCQPPPRRRPPIDGGLVCATTVEQFRAPPFGGNRVLRSWHEPEELDRRVDLGRAMAVCFTSDGRIVLVSRDGETGWSHPGGGRDHGERIEEALSREVYEEACARVLRSTFLGWERFVHLDRAGNVAAVHHQARFAARVALEPFVARHETAGRRLVEPAEVPGLLPFWPPEALARLVERALQASSQPGWRFLEVPTECPGLVLRELTEPDPTTLNTRFGVWLEDARIGRVDLNPLNPPNYVLGYALDETARGHGYATAACRAALDFARQRLGATVMWAGVSHGNHKSVAVLRRLGFVAVAELERHIRFRLPLPA